MSDGNENYGQEFNSVGNEYNEGYLSNVQGSRGSVKTSDLESTVSDVEPAAAAPAGEATSEVITGSASITGGASLGTTTGVVATSTGAVVTTTGVVIAVGAGLITATSLFVAVSNFRYETDPWLKEMTYSFTVECDGDTTVYVSLLDEENNQVAINPHEIVLMEALEEEQHYNCEISGSFTDLIQNYNYNVEVFYYEGMEKNILYQSEEPLVVVFNPLGVKQMNAKTDPQRKAATIITEVYFDDADMDKTIEIILKDEEDAVVNVTGFVLQQDEEEEYIECNFFEYDDGLHGVTNTHTFFDLIPGTTYTVDVRSIEYDEKEEATITDLESSTFTLEEAESYLPYAYLSYYNVNYEEGYVTLSYYYSDNGVTYDEFAILVENITWEGTLQEGYQTMRGDPNSVEEPYTITISGPTGYDYKISLCARNSNETEYIVLTQSAIYY